MDTYALRKLGRLLGYVLIAVALAIVVINFATPSKGFPDRSGQTSQAVVGYPNDGDRAWIPNGPDTEVYSVWVARHVTASHPHRGSWQPYAPSKADALPICRLPRHNVIPLRLNPATNVCWFNSDDIFQPSRALRRTWEEAVHQPGCRQVYGNPHSDRELDRSCQPGWMKPASHR